MAKGYAGRILKVNLSDHTFSVNEPEELFYRTYGGGPGIGLFYLLKDFPPGADPLGPDNLLIFAAGLLTGSPAPCVPRYTICARSPLTGALGKSEAGGWWGPALKAAGFDAVVIRGKASQPVYLWIYDGKVEFKDARHLWGLDTGATAEAIRQELGVKPIRIAGIGPAGENLVRYAGVVNELSHFNGRNGMGAVMGSKNLKAIAVRGTGKIGVADPEWLKDFARWVSREAKVHPLSKALHLQGTPAGVTANSAAGSLPTHNWNLGSFEKAEEIGGERLTSELLVRRGGCFFCPIRCKRVVQFNGEYQVDPLYGGPEYETLAALGSNCGVADLPLLAKANELCNRYGMDTISTGGAIAFAMECFEKGYISLAETGGLDLRFGNGEALLQIIHQIAFRKGFGAWLADGSAAAAKRIGDGCERFLVQVKGQDVPLHDPRVKTGIGLQYALAPNGADHWFAQHDPFFAPGNPIGRAAGAPLGILEGIENTDLTWRKVRFALYTGFLNFAYDALGVCVFGFAARSVIPVEKLAEITEAVTGWQTSLWELMKLGERLNCMARVFNCRQGFGPMHDTLPARFFEPLASGPHQGKLNICPEAFYQARDLYYEMAGWDDQGRPRKGKLWELNLDWLVN